MEDLGKNLLLLVWDLYYKSLPFLRVTWTISGLIGVGLFVLAFILRKNPERKKSPWVVGIIGLLFILSSGTQLVYSFFL